MTYRPTPPPRTAAQRQAALDQANARRYARARIKDRIHADPTWRELVAAVAGEAPDEDEVAGMSVAAVLGAAPGIGPQAARRWLREARVRTNPLVVARMGDLDPVQRARLALIIRRRYWARQPAVLERLAARPRHHYQRRHGARKAA